MEPLDLTQSPPRGPRLTMAGLAFMPRTIDKLRAEQPGGNIGPYLNESVGISQYMCKRAGLDMEELRAIVASAADEAEIERWLLERLDPGAVAETNRKLEVLGVERLSPENRALVEHYHPVMAERPELVRYFDIFEADDAATYGPRATT